jgi:hypothetical protein
MYVYDPGMSVSVCKPTILLCLYVCMYAYGPDTFVPVCTVYNPGTYVPVTAYSPDMPVPACILPTALVRLYLYVYCLQP